MPHAALAPEPTRLPHDRLVPWRRLLASPGALLLLVVLCTRLQGGEVGSSTALAGLGAFIALFLERGALRALVVLGTLAPLFVAVADSSASLATGALDSGLSAIDQALLGEPAASWFARVLPWGVVREGLAVGYLSYYLLIPAAWLAASRRSPERGEAALLALVSTFTVSALAAIALPTVGPLAERPLTVGSGLFERAIDLVYRLDPGGGAAFPSSHVAVGLVAGWILWQCAPGARHVVVVLCAALAVSTVQGSFHYLADVPAGLLVAAVGVWVFDRRSQPADGGTVPALHRWWRAVRSGRSGP